jgi:hypothetical protein
MNIFTDWRQRLRKRLEADLHDSSSEISENQWQFGPAIVDVRADTGSAFVTVTRALEFDHPELTGQRLERRFNTSDDVEAAALEIAGLIQTLQ